MSIESLFQDLTTFYNSFEKLLLPRQCSFWELFITHCFFLVALHSCEIT
jgi:hypothetical protein